MRAFSLAVGLATFFAATAALAEPAKGSAFGKGASGPSSGGASPGDGDTSSSDQAFQTRDYAASATQDPGDNRARTKPWDVGVSAETHHVIRQEDTAGSQRNLQYLDLFADYDLTPYDSLGINAGFYAYAVSDQGENGGIRFDDMLASYTRFVPLPAEFNLRLSASTTIPTSLASQRAGIITAPGLTARFDRKFFNKVLTVSLSGRGRGYIVRDDTATGGNPNPLVSARATLSADVMMPFWEPLHFGARVADGYTWYYDVHGSDVSTAGSGNPSWVQPTTNGATDNQPIQQSYGGEIYARYFFPSFVGLKTDLLVAFAQGDPTLGYTSIVHDGVDHFYLFYRRDSEVYAALSVEY